MYNTGPSYAGVDTQATAIYGTQPAATLAGDYGEIYFFNLLWNKVWLTAIIIKLVSSWFAHDVISQFFTCLKSGEVIWLIRFGAYMN